MQSHTVTIEFCISIFRKHMALLRLRKFSFRRIQQIWQRHEFNGEPMYGPGARVPSISCIQKNYQKLMDQSCVTFENQVIDYSHK